MDEADDESLPPDDVDDVEVIIEGWWLWPICWWCGRMWLRFILLAAAINEPMLWLLLVLLMLWLIDISGPVGDWMPVGLCTR